MPPQSLTERGFGDYAKFTDDRGNTILVRESSADPLTRVWVFVKGPKGEDANPSMHLDVARAQILIAALQEFIKDQRAKDEANEEG